MSFRACALAADLLRQSRAFGRGPGRVFACLAHLLVSSERQQVDTAEGAHAIRPPHHRPLSSRSCLGRAALRACMRGWSNRHGTAAGAAASARRCEDRRVRDALAPPAEPGRPHARALGERRRLGRPRIRCVALRLPCFALRVLLRVLNVVRGCLLPPQASCPMPPTATCLAPPYFSGEARRRAGPSGWRTWRIPYSRTPPHRDC